MSRNLHALEEERANLVMLEACGRALVVLARSINEQLEHGHALSVPETVEIREFAIDLMTHAAEVLNEARFSPVNAVERPLRVGHAVRRAMLS